MGLLKHVVVPIFLCIHLMSAFNALDPPAFVDMIAYGLKEGETQPERELHLIGIIRGFNIAMAFLLIMGLFQESAHFRTLVIAGDLIIQAVATVDAYNLGNPMWYAPGIIGLVALVGLLSRSMEPGLFTKDKTKDKNN
mmetsp:Transcript_28629/g.43998  ORF Transcript_28629/g.43998 Transcript_28629/m.43998 type:complete len:138 (-) Transcript_28629:122-535(-)|eukprot:CAMPEP_0118688950 /NCGR_PEP_ID=MMETSP0800-20121206/9202_1 /TAXON_ID=210618 ORGANISM="Striatella unipunctata, Strain CCMP2910" /NCGR_SAMPLE_ID=MMETSP0800 /ASSEMBLY_ACC=CAM_ASM_000638 /LENGTH=137 /DNA_ID=CAMNT_0006586261 /DNA_START=42 /DNA_END=455 /DNA_ORIENTATION=-